MTPSKLEASNSPSSVEDRDRDTALGVFDGRLQRHLAILLWARVERAGQGQDIAAAVARSIV